MAAGAVTAALFSPAAAAQQTDPAAVFPSKPVRIIVQTGPGSPPDVRARQIAQKLSAEWGQPVVVENRPGASGQIALEALARAAPDGHTLCLTGGAPLTITPHLRKQPFDPLKDFVPVAGIGFAPILLIVNGTLPVTDARQLLQYARKHPGRLNAATWGEATTPHLALEQFSRANDVQIAHVPYKEGSSRVVTDLIAGEVQMAFEWLHSTRAHIRTGRLKALAVAGSERLTGYPDIPTFAEAGVAGMDAIGGWLGFVAPANTPPAVVRKIGAAVARAFEDPELRAQTIEIGGYTNVRQPEEFARFIEDEYRRYGQLISEAGIRLQ
ncbi:MAG TPA: tripartite tricarboxylate transporter substrate binding protein [Burkholderiaceae bacterium]|nr:tripartite tricarboxylate transporter substrate binding protein [Burkholderiaceae bacterium]